MSIKVIQPGLSTTIQDGGREGFYHLGIPPSGAMDQYAMKAANLLVGNPEILRCWSVPCSARNWNSTQTA